jgi:nucleotide-binding universal stress UspA family protein
MKNILLPTDFSEASINALEYAVQLLKSNVCTFYVLNVYTPIYLYTPSIYEDFTTVNVDIGEQYKSQSEENIRKAIRNIKDKFPSKIHTFLGITSFNTLASEINTIVDAYDINCVIMGTKGATGLKEVFIGSETMHTLKHCKVPLLGVPHEYSFIDLKEVLFATNYESGNQQAGLTFLNNLCSSHLSRLVFLNAYYGIALNDAKKKNKKELELFFERDAHVTELCNGMDVYEAIENYHLQHVIDLLVLVHTSHNFFENLLFTPVVKKIVHHAEVPFLILPPAKAI